MAPAYAVPAMLKDANLTLQDFDFYEIHEAFAAQVLCTLKAWESPEYCKEQARARPAARQHRPREAQCERLERGHRPSVRRHRHAHRRVAGEAAGRVAHREARPDLGVHRRRHGRRRDPREGLEGAGPGNRENYCPVGKHSRSRKFPVSRPGTFQLVSDETKLTARMREVVHEALRPLSRRLKARPRARRMPTCRRARTSARSARKASSAPPRISTTAIRPPAG